MLSVVMLSVIMLNVFMLSVVMLNVVKLSVVAPELNASLVSYTVLLKKEIFSDSVILLIYEQINFHT